MCFMLCFNGEPRNVFYAVLLFSRQVMFTLHDPMDRSMPASLCPTISQSLPKFMSTALVMPSNHLILSPFSPSAFSLSQHQGVFQLVSSSHLVAQSIELQH